MCFYGAPKLTDDTLKRLKRIKRSWAAVALASSRRMCSFSGAPKLTVGTLKRLKRFKRSWAAVALASSRRMCSFSGAPKLTDGTLKRLKRFKRSWAAVALASSRCMCSFSGAPKLTDGAQRSDDINILYLLGPYIATAPCSKSHCVRWELFDLLLWVYGPGGLMRIGGQHKAPPDCHLYWISNSWSSPLLTTLAPNDVLWGLQPCSPETTTCVCAWSIRCLIAEIKFGFQR